MGMGGFVSGPCGLAAFILRKPLYVHEQNAIPGLTNRVLSHVANTVMQAFPESFKHNHGVVVTGNPVRKEITELVKPEIRMTERKGNIRLLIVGGSLGAQVLNENVPQALAALDMDLRPDVWHQAGKGKLETTIQDYKNLKVEAKVTEFIDNMADAYEWADLVICRAGALTVSELASAGLASILVPYAYAVDDHQTANAKFLTKANAAILIPQDQLAIKLKVTLSDLLQSGRAKLIEMAMAARQLSRPDATKVVAQICLGMTAGSASGVTHG
jgi:UDP-N-acetylglucosamine--N-acetylmuramyl-(pentapeptide) pyrophosphoryl-undecaprenol N-acetylglucosamine transferase